VDDDHGRDGNDTIRVAQATLIILTGRVKALAMIAEAPAVVKLERSPR
jgi:hypothetical protein